MGSSRRWERRTWFVLCIKVNELVQCEWLKRGREGVVFKLLRNRVRPHTLAHGHEDIMLHRHSINSDVGALETSSDPRPRPIRRETLLSWPQLRQLLVGGGCFTSAEISRPKASLLTKGLIQLLLQNSSLIHKPNSSSPLVKKQTSHTKDQTIPDQTILEPPDFLASNIPKHSRYNGITPYKPSSTRHTSFEQEFVNMPKSILLPSS